MQGASGTGIDQLDISLTLVPRPRHLGVGVGADDQRIVDLLIVDLQISPVLTLRATRGQRAAETKAVAGWGSTFSFSEHTDNGQRPKRRSLQHAEPRVPAGWRIHSAKRMTVRAGWPMAGMGEPGFVCRSGT
ncbi:hypothetical protein PYCCODRAFT_612406 [Trametes coccinea BRFM310]|uniref:Uncharacterized protein n=1 Tax=Trametes coccinea (strain BRFM310) TaxID=1353009 RepID=A0A1Y2J4R6_TRAC3|nr:hypothetical protein PYCCODRAFT_612406 [Trametes coccinea BRFM310]